MLGFFGATIGKYFIDLRLDARLRERDGQALAAEIHAELGWAREQTKQIAKVADESRGAQDEEGNVRFSDTNYERIQMPAFEIFPAHIGKLGLLEPAITRRLVAIRGRVIEHNQLVTQAKGVFGNELSAEFLEYFSGGVNVTRRLIEQVNVPLAEEAGITPFNWPADEPDSAVVDQAETAPADDADTEIK